MTPEQVHASQILMLEDLKKKVEGEKKEHWIFECSGPRPNKTSKFEDFCGDTECRSMDNQRVIAHNSALTTITAHIDEIINKLKV